MLPGDGFVLMPLKELISDMIIVHINSAAVEVFGSPSFSPAVATLYDPNEQQNRHTQASTIIPDGIASIPHAAADQDIPSEILEGYNLVHRRQIISYS
jgi:hypothetical protein